MPLPDLNLLVALDVLLATESVAVAAERLRLSPSAMSRTLARLRSATGDPLLVRAGRRLVPTPRALALRDRIAPLLQDAADLLRPERPVDPRAIERAFTIRTRDGFVETFGAPLVAALADEAPGLRLDFVLKSERDSTPLREGTVDLETGIVGPVLGPELKAQALFRDCFVGAVRAGHPLAAGTIDVAGYVAAGHVHAGRPGAPPGPVDDALAAVGHRRRIAVVVSGFSAALMMARGSDLVATVPERHTTSLRHGMATLALPFPLDPMTISLIWHPRMDADPAHRWLRQRFRQICLDVIQDGFN
ncbi:LysR family transcriptional regulator [Prosthecomicrobium sp. N25]|uniref:LysR family transcriptional regulator n=1 Tax=Prosthecomicrobium sp. N25 TaxID=3129254 RepID=UPI0030778121